MIKEKGKMRKGQKQKDEVPAGIEPATFRNDLKLESKPNDMTTNPRDLLIWTVSQIAYGVRPILGVIEPITPFLVLVCNQTPSFELKIIAYYKKQ